MPRITIVWEGNFTNYLNVSSFPSTRFKPGGLQPSSRCNPAIQSLSCFSSINPSGSTTWRTTCLKFLRHIDLTTTTMHDTSSVLAIPLHNPAAYIYAADCFLDSVLFAQISGSTYINGYDTLSCAVIRKRLKCARKKALTSISILSDLFFCNPWITERAILLKCDLISRRLIIVAFTGIFFWNNLGII